MSELIPLDSKMGERMLKDILKEEEDSHKYIQPNLIASHYEQKTDSTCGIATSVMLFNARLASLHQAQINEYGLLMHPLLVKATENTIGDIFDGGMNIRELSKILDTFGCANRIFSCMDKDDEQAIDEFRSMCKDVFKECHDSSGAIIVNYFMKEIGQPFDVGHFSPIAAYHEESDRVLLLDCWEPNVCWVKLQDLYRAMATLDGDTYRGYIVVVDVNTHRLLRSPFGISGWQRRYNWKRDWKSTVFCMILGGVIGFVLKRYSLIDLIADIVINGLLRLVLWITNWIYPEE